MIMNLAHRGASSYAPENTLAAFYKGLEMGATGIETDIQQSKDGVLFLLHDKTVDRTTNGSGQPQAFTWAELSELDAGGWFAPAYAGERLVTLATFLHAFGRKNIHFALELKQDGIEEPVLRMIDAYRVRDKTTVTSFAFERIERMRRLDASIALGHLLDAIHREAIDRLLAIGVGQICPKAASLSKEAVQLAKAHGLQVRAWGATTPELMRHVLDCGADGTTINFPDLLADALRSSVKTD
ncbi:MAG: hypothetical protein K0Q59_3458 [Paenibacillus sp.]|jgi:glycerophosphoryl diester phosphodiesterase|nr:hypothetical protein [Paenibacillus sp.]